MFGEVMTLSILNNTNQHSFVLIIEVRFRGNEIDFSNLCIL